DDSRVEIDSAAGNGDPAAAAVGVAGLEGAGIDNATVRTGAEGEFAAAEIVAAGADHSIILDREGVDVAVGFQLCRCRVDRTGVVDADFPARTAGAHRNTCSPGVIDHHVAAGPESDDPTRGVHLPGVLEEVAHQHHVTVLTGDGPVVPHSGSGVAAEVVG